jgi:predicted nucleic acid-binding protein
MQVIADTTPLSELFKIDQLELLRYVYQRIVIPEIVLQELRNAKSLPGLSKAVERTDWIAVQTLHDSNKIQQLIERYPHIHRGEAGAIALTKELNANRIIIDDKQARRAAKTEGVPVIGTVGVLLLAYKRELIPRQRAQFILDQLFQGTAYIGASLYHEASRQLKS